MAKEQREKFSPKFNLEYVVELLFDKPTEGEHEEYGPWHCYGVKVIEGKGLVGRKVSWFPKDQEFAQIQELGVGKGDRLRVMVEQGEGKEKIWKIAPVEPKPPDPQEAPPPKSPPATEPPPAPYGASDNGNGWTPEKRATMVEWWRQKAIKAIRDEAEDEVGMSLEQTCKFYNTGLIGSLQGKPPADEECTDGIGVAAETLYELLGASLMTLEDPKDVKAWPDKYGELAKQLPKDKHDALLSAYKALNK